MTTDLSVSDDEDGDAGNGSTGGSCARSPGSSCGCRLSVGISGTRDWSLWRILSHLEGSVADFIRFRSCQFRDREP